MSRSPASVRWGRRVAELEKTAAMADAAGTEGPKMLAIPTDVSQPESVNALFARINAVYAHHFSGPVPPARATVQVAALPLGAAVEIDAIAFL